MHRKTTFYPGYGYVTGDGLFGDIASAIGKLVTSKEAKDIAVEGTKAIAKSGGNKLGEKLVDKAFKSKPTPAPTITQATNKINPPPAINQPTETKQKKVHNRNLLKKIYGNALLKKKTKK